MSDITAHSSQGAVGRDRGQIVWGLVLVAIGAAFLAERQGWVAVDDPVRLWPLILFAIGLGKLASGCAGSLQSAFTLAWIGTIFLLHNFHVIRLRHSWPLFIVMAGILTLWKALAPRAATPRTEAGHAGKPS